MGCGGSSLKPDSTGNTDCDEDRQVYLQTYLQTSKEGDEGTEGGELLLLDFKKETLDSPDESSDMDSARDSIECNSTNFILSEVYEDSSSEDEEYYRDLNDPFDFFTESQRLFDRDEEGGSDDSHTPSFKGLLGGIGGGCKKTAISPRGGAAPPAKGLPPQDTQKISDSQLDFFKMLDERIDNGPDDDSFCESVGGKGPLDPSSRRWSASKVPRSPTQSNNFNLISSKTDTNATANLKEQTKTQKIFVSSPEEDPNFISDSIKEQYMFLGNLYTFTRPRMQSCNGIPVTVAVTPAKTQEDLHLECEKSGMAFTVNNVATSDNWEKFSGDEDDDFWMDSEVFDEIKTDKDKVNGKRRTSLPNDIVRNGLVSLRTVIE